MISVRHLSATVKAGAEVLSGVSFELGKGQILGLYGPNGSGKSTLLKALAGVTLDRVLIGEIIVNQKNIRDYQLPEERVKHVLYLGSDFHAPFDLSVRELFEMGSEVMGRSLGEMSEWVEAMNLTSFLPRLFRTLSDGEKQWIMFARVLIQSPEVIILDESFSKLDLDKLIFVSRLIRKKAATGTTFLIASHDLNFLSESADQLLFLKSGKMLGLGQVTDMLTNAFLERLYPEISLQVVRSPETGRFKVLY